MIESRLAKTTALGIGVLVRTMATPGLGPPPRSVQALVMGGAAQDHVSELVAAFAQRLDVMQ